MFTQYKGVMRQAEQLDNHYDKALELLNKDKASTFNDLSTDLEIIIELLLVEFNEKQKVDNPELIIGTFLSLKPVFEKLETLIESIKALQFNHQNYTAEQILEMKQKLEKESAKIKSNFKNFFNYNVDNE